MRVRVCVCGVHLCVGGGVCVFVSSSIHYRIVSIFIVTVLVERFYH